MPLNPYQLPFDKAIDFFKKKKILPTNTWKDVDEAYSAIAFTIASITRLSLLADVKSIIEKQLKSGVSPEAFREQFKEAVIKAGWNPQFSPYRVNLILRQNVKSAMSFGRWEQQEEPKFKQRNPNKMWRHRDSVFPRPHHKALDGKVFRSTDPVWKAIFPPPWGCNCTAYSMSDRQLKKEGLTLSTPPKLEDIVEPGFTQGFPESLEKQRSQLIERAIASLPPNLAAILKEDVDFAEQRRDARGRWAKTGGMQLAPKSTAISPNEEEKKRTRQAKKLARIAEKEKYEQERNAIGALQTEKANSAFDNAPPLIKKAVSLYGQPEIIPPIEFSSAFYNGNMVHMNKTPDDYFDAVYRHEWGHYADHEMGKKMDAPKSGKGWYASSSPEGKKAFDLDEEGFSGERFRAALKNVPDEPATIGFLADTVGCLTKNKYGGGHSDDYVAIPENRRTEVFANIVALIGSGNKEQMKSAMILAPNMSKFLLDKLNG